MKDSEKIYELKLHESIELKDTKPYLLVVRVPGGWLYCSLLNGYTSMSFVPFNNEFQTIKRKPEIIPL